ncbi:MAG TPA: SLC13 family permease [Beijerinckiaceae bacterium]|nr:SLC13 family permease [Beijerinckiaceae bacterium]
MTLQQSLAVGIVAAMMVLFIWGRFRYDLVAALALLAAVAAGVVPAKEAFSGFADDIVIIVASALLVSAAVARSGVTEAVMRRIAPYATTTQTQVFVLVIAVTAMSAFVKNIGALAMIMPVAFQIARRTNTSPSAFLMPMAFGSLLGGIITLVGTSPNIIVARMRAELVGEPFGMFDFTPVGLGLAIAGVAFLTFGYRLLPQNRRGTASLHAALNIKDYTTEARVTAASSVAGQTVADLKEMGEGEVTVTAIVRDDRVRSPLPDAELREGDIVLLKGEPDALEQVVSEAELKLGREDKTVESEDPTDEVGVVEAVVRDQSVMVGRSARDLELFQRLQINLIAVSRAGERIAERLREVKLRAGDLVVLRGNHNRMPDTLRELGLLPLVERTLALGSARRRWLTVAILAVTVLLLAFNVVPVAIAFFGAAVCMVLFGAIPIREAYESVEWPILVMLGALIPVSEAIRTTGSTELLAGYLSIAGNALPGWGALVLIMVAAMAVTPFLNNAATVLVMAPIAASFAKSLGYQPDPFLMAVAIGAACDFLTPIGHQCNTLVMGPGGYRFADYARVGAPLSLLVIVLGVPLIMLFWPLG